MNLHVINQAMKHCHMKLTNENGKSHAKHMKFLLRREFWKRGGDFWRVYNNEGFWTSVFGGFGRL